MWGPCLKGSVNKRQSGVLSSPCKGLGNGSCWHWNQTTENEYFFKYRSGKMILSIHITGFFGEMESSKLYRDDNFYNLFNLIARFSMILVYVTAMFSCKFPGCPATSFFPIISFFSPLFHTPSYFFLFFSSSLLLTPRFFRKYKKEEKVYFCHITCASW